MSADPHRRHWHLEEQRLKTAYSARESRDARRAWERPEHVFVEHERERHLLRLLARCGVMPLGDKKILEVGCGTGGKLRNFIKWGATPENVMGVDLLSASLAYARDRLPQGVRLECCNAADIPVPSGSMDIILQATMFSSVLELPLKHQIAQELLRVLKPGGVIIWCDLLMDNPWSDTVRGIDKREIQDLFPRCKIELKRVGLARPITQRLARRSWLATYLLSQIPWLCIQYLGSIRPLKPHLYTSDAGAA